MALPKKNKHPGAVLDYGFDLTGWLDEGDIIAAAEVTAADGVELQQQYFNETQIVVWLAGGTIGDQYLIYADFLTSLGRQDRVSFTLVIKE